MYWCTWGDAAYTDYIPPRVVQPLLHQDMTKLDTDKMIEDMDDAVLAASSSSSNKAADAGNASASSSGSRTVNNSVGATKQKIPLIRFSMSQLMTSQTPAGDAARTSQGGASTTSTLTADSSSGRQPAGTAAQSTGAEAKAVSKAAIVSFRKVEVEFGPMDFETDQAFLEAVYVFVHTLPLADLWQTAEWRSRIEYLQGVQVTLQAHLMPCLLFRISSAPCLLCITCSGATVVTLMCHPNTVAGMKALDTATWFWMFGLTAVIPHVVLAGTRASYGSRAQYHRPCPGAGLAYAQV